MPGQISSHGEASTTAQSPNQSTPMGPASKGLRIDLQDISPAQVTVDNSYEKVPIAHAAGIPLFVKRLPEMGKVARVGERHIIVRMMSDPKVGLAPLDWQYGGLLPPAPPVLLGRSDGIAFERDDWYILDDFEMSMLNDGPRRVSRRDFVRFIKRHHAKSTVNIALEVMFPRDTKVCGKGLHNRPDLNGRRGICVGKYDSGRVAVLFQDIEQPVLMKPVNPVNLLASP